MSLRLDERRGLALCAAALSLALALSPTPPCVDWPQHLALAEQLRRLWLGDPEAHALYATNAATHNGGVHFVTAALSLALGTSVAGKLVLAAYPPMFLFGGRALLVALGLPAARALWLVPCVLGFAFGWGFLNFCFGASLAAFAAAWFRRSLDDGGGKARAWLLALSVPLGVVHVMGTLLAGTLCASLGLEAIVRRRARPLAVVLSLAAFAPGVAFDAWVTWRHLSLRADSYTSYADGWDQAGLLKKAMFLGGHVAGLWGSYLDTALAWAVLAALVVALATGIARARPPWVAPLALGLVAYFAIPHVWMSTHLVYQRAAFLIVVGLLAAVPPGPPWIDRAGAAFAGVSAVVSVAHLAAFAWETRDARDVLRAVPVGARVTTVAEPPRTRVVRMPVLAHLGAWAVLDGARDDSFSFGRFMSLPIVYLPYATEASPSPSWEQAAGPYLPESKLARRFPWVVAKLREGESVEAGRARLFRDRAVRTVAQRGAYAVFDARE